MAIATPREHFRLYQHAAVFRLLYQLRRSAAPDEPELQGALSRFPFLADHLDQLRRTMPEGVTWGEGFAWWQAEIESREAEATAALPFLTLTRACQIPFEGRVVLVLAGLPEADPRFGAVFAYLMGSGDVHRRASLSLIWLLMTGGAGDELAEPPDPWSLCRPLLENGLLVAADPNLPRPEWELSVPTAIWDLLRGDPPPREGWWRHRPVDELPEPDQLFLPPDLLDTIRRLPDVIRGGSARYLIIRGMRGSERQEVAEAIARGLGLATIAVDGAALQEGRHRDLLGPVCTLAGAMPVLTYELGPGETVRPPEWRGYRGPVAILLNHEGGLAEAESVGTLTLTLPFPTPELRHRCWEAALAGHSCPEIEEAARRILLPTGLIRRVAGLSVAQAALQQRAEITLADIREAARTLNRQQLDTLATRLEPSGTWDDLVMNETLQLKLKELQRRCRFRERLLEHLGMRYTAGANRGVRAMLSGPSGTGKTLSTRILAAVLEMDLYRVDLAAVVNKYIGETEKNLNQVLSRAEELDVILLLDEGDSLLAKRSEVRSSNDRYANLETNYLLQRLEHYNGIVLITTNASQLIDQAFQRRMDVVIDFLPPGPDERIRLWQMHLPKDHAVSESDLRRLAIRCAMTGGQIRNAALHATLAALDQEKPIAIADLIAGVESEYRKAGAVRPSLDEEPKAPSSNPLDDLFSTLPNA